jgi:hypothetical protein
MLYPKDPKDPKEVDFKGNRIKVITLSRKILNLLKKLICF